MTEERHTLSDPRLISTEDYYPNATAPSASSSTPKSPKWEVDIFRTGVQDPIDTIEISEDTLPPRTNKKGKVLWRLPPTSEKLPSFGAVERRRIMDLFKERKKNRRKKSQNGSNAVAAVAVAAAASVANAGGSYNGGGGGGSGGSDGDNSVGGGKNGGNGSGNCDGANNDGTATPTDSTASLSTENGKNSSSTLQEKNDNYGSKPGKPVVALDAADNENNGGVKGIPPSGSSVANKVSKGDSKVTTGKVKKTSASAYLSKRKKKKDTSTFVPSTIEDDVPDVRDHFNRKEEEKLAALKADNKAVQNTVPPPPGLPPGFEDSLSSMTIDAPTSQNTTGMTIDTHTVPNNSVPIEQPVSKPHPPLNTAPAPPPPSRYIIIPEHNRPNKTDIHNRPSLAVAAATAFVDLYYPHISHGHSSELVFYYTTHAQKSISVGGAHSVVADRSDITLQLSSLSNSRFFVRGVVAQDSHDGSGVHIQVTGVVQTSALPSSSGVSPFAHSISLVPASAEQRELHKDGRGEMNDELAYAFNIHNDALSLLTVGDMMAPVAASPWHDSMTAQHQHQQQPRHHPQSQQPQHQPSQHHIQHQKPTHDVAQHGLSSAPSLPPPGLF